MSTQSDSEERHRRCMYSSGGSLRSTTSHPALGKAALTSLTLMAIAFPLDLRADDEAAQREFFETQIRPVLVKHCDQCHSKSAKEVKGGLRLDSAAGWRTGGDSGPAIVPGKPDESLLIEALKYDGLEMPPAGRLPDSVVRDFERWIAMGAIDPRDGDGGPAVTKVIDIEAGRNFWSFQPVSSPPVPEVMDGEWPRSDIDRFVLAKLEQQGLLPAPDAASAALLRRLYYDLTGLPPTPDEQREWEASWDRDARAALADVVDRLLESPQFGVHWGRHWLDVARYADSNGSDFNATFHNAWRYRDYVVDAFNNDKAFDQFVREQIAGDLLPYDSDEQRTEQMVATGFLMIGTKMLSERDKEKLRMDVVDEQINTVGKAFMSLTLGCARCHDHKFDPIPTRDYYALAGIFRSTSTLEGESQQYVSTWPRRSLPVSAEHMAAVKQHADDTKKVNAELKVATSQLDEHKRIAAALNAGENRLTVDDVDAELIGEWKKSTFSKGYVGKGYIHDDRTGKGEKAVKFTIMITEAGRYDVRLSYTPGGGRSKKVPIEIQHAEGTATVVLNQQPKPTIDGIYASVGTYAFAAKSKAVVTLSTGGTTRHVIADAVQLVQVDDDGKPIVTDPMAGEELVAARKAVEQSQSVVDELNEQLKQLGESQPPPLPKAIAVADHKEVGDCEVRIRGEHLNLGESVPRGFLQVASEPPSPALPSDQSGRRELAEWIASSTHPLTARVIANRLWHHLLGEGLVRSVDNFGQLGERPTHPELLDRLASDLMEDGWSLKRAIRRIVLSRVYRLGTVHDEAAWQADPENRLLWRAHRRRLPAEALRDSMLAVSGQLDLAADGSPVEGLGTLVTTNNASAKKYQQRATSKRSLYLPIIRNELPPILTAFDFADPDLVTGRRPVTNVPAQALLLMNSPFVMDCADKVSEQLLSRGFSDDRVLVAELYQLTFTRQPTPAEVDRAVAFLRTDQSADAITAQQLSRLVHVLLASTEFRMLL